MGKEGYLILDKEDYGREENFKTSCDGRLMSKWKMDYL